MSQPGPTRPEWPDIPWPEWRTTCTALHLWCQIAGKYRLAHTPWLNHSWHATLYVTPRGLTTGPVFDGGRAISVDFDFQDHAVVVSSDSGVHESFRLHAMSVAAFLSSLQAAVGKAGGSFDIHGSPSELDPAVPFAEDTRSHPYDAPAVARFHHALLSSVRVFSRFRTGFTGKASPVHLFWGALDLAVTRFSGRPAPPHPGGIPNLPDAVTREAYSHEVSSAGFWAGGAGVDEPMFYSYAYPTPAEFRSRPVRPAAARWDDRLGEFLLPYEAVRMAADPEAMLMEFLQSTYEAAADTAAWDRAALERPFGPCGTP